VSSKFVPQAPTGSKNLRATLAQVKTGRLYNFMARSAEIRQLSLLTILPEAAERKRYCRSSPNVGGLRFIFWLRKINAKNRH
jgi:hypothetical protein